VFAIKEF
jgi:hypothetical protein